MKTQADLVVAGDSWAAFVCTYKSMETALSEAGLQNVSVQPTCASTVEPGVKLDGRFDSHTHITSLAAIKDSSVWQHMHSICLLKIG